MRADLLRELGGLRARFVRHKHRQRKASRWIASGPAAAEDERVLRASRGRHWMHQKTEREAAAQRSRCRGKVAAEGGTEGEGPDPLFAGARRLCSRVGAPRVQILAPAENESDQADATKAQWYSAYLAYANQRNGRMTPAKGATSKTPSWQSSQASSERIPLWGLKLPTMHLAIQQKHDPYGWERRGSHLGRNSESKSSRSREAR